MNSTAKSFALGGILIVSKSVGTMTASGFVLNMGKACSSFSHAPN